MRTAESFSCGISPMAAARLAVGVEPDYLGDHVCSPRSASYTAGSGNSPVTPGGSRAGPGKAALAGLGRQLAGTSMITGTTAYLVP
jgi:hypothetical protein